MGSQSVVNWSSADISCVLFCGVVSLCRPGKSLLYSVPFGYGDSIYQRRSSHSHDNVVTGNKKKVRVLRIGLMGLTNSFS